MDYLKSSIQFAPYLWNWYAWSYLLPPHTAAANIARRHLAIMESFIESPELHEEAISAGILGGPFIDLPTSYRPQVVELIEKTKQQCTMLIQLDDDICAFNKYLHEQASGISMESLYRHIPDSLKGLIELVYNLDNNPQVRYIEPLIYDKYLDTTQQSICLRETKDDRRSFCFGTPYIDHDETLQLFVKFSDEIIDDLVKMKYHPGSKDELWERCNLPANKRALFDSFFTKNIPSRKCAEVADDQINIRYFGHACVLLQSKDTKILIDPALGYSHSGSSDDRYTLDDLPDVIDYVLITHNHQDHFLFETLLQIRHKVRHIVVPSNTIGAIYDPSMKLILRQLGFTNIIVLDEFDEIHVNPNAMIMALPFLGEHGDLNIQTKRSYYISLMNRTFLFLADSNNLDNNLYQYIYKKIGKVDTIYIGMECIGAPVSWLYGPLYSKPLAYAHDQQRRLSGSDYLKAWDIIQQFECQEVFVYAMGLEPWLSYVMAVDYNDSSPAIVESNKLINQCRQHGIVASRLFGKQEWLY